MTGEGGSKKYSNLVHGLRVKEQKVARDGREKIHTPDIWLEG